MSDSYEQVKEMVRDTGRKLQDAVSFKDQRQKLSEYADRAKAAYNKYTGGSTVKAATKTVVSKQGDSKPKVVAKKTVRKRVVAKK